MLSRLTSYLSWTGQRAVRAVCCALLLTGLIAAAPIHAQEQKIKVAEVNGEAIFLEEVMKIAEQLPADIRQQPLPNYFDRIVDDVIDSRLAAAAGNDAGLTNNPEVLAQMSIAAQRVLAEAYITTELRKVVTEEEVQKAYQLFISDESAREEIKARHILVASEAEAKAIIAELNSGADFVSLAKEKSTGPSGPNGGDLGYFARGAMVPSFENAAFALSVGSHSSEPVQTQFGWHIIKLEDKKTAEAPPIETLRGQLQANLANQALSRIIETLRAPASISRLSFDEVRAATQAAANNQ
ncbi:MAG: peptidylprolyl isomerase [Candidatus Puniceispirillaceae bacterium]|jgi:peptidyl-prolyl cis-trans isomerase C|nr:peptidylprolyl isomerase [Pseudomonadota bacterium]